MPSRNTAGNESSGTPSASSPDAVNARSSADGGPPAVHGSAVATCGSIRASSSRAPPASRMCRNRYAATGYV